MVGDLITVEGPIEYRWGVDAVDVGDGVLTTRQVSVWKANLTVSAPVVARSDTVYACPDCDARYLGEQRREDCNTWCRRLGPGGLCPCCVEPIAITDLPTPDQFRPRTNKPTRRT